MLLPEKRDIVFTVTFDVENKKIIVDGVEGEDDS